MGYEPYSKLHLSSRQFLRQHVELNAASINYTEQKKMLPKMYYAKDI